MAKFALAKLLKKNSPLAAHLSAWLGPDAQVCIQAPDDSLLWGQPLGAAQERCPLRLGDELQGWVSGGENPAALAGLLAFALQQESEKKDLAGELLERYRELNLLYHLSETLTTSPFPAAIASAALAETVRLIPTAAGLILLKQEGEGDPHPIAEWGADYHPVPHCALVARVLLSGKAELANAIDGDGCFSETAGLQISLIAAPLKTEKNILGVLLLVDQPTRSFSAGELKLLNTVAQQAAPLLEVSRLYQMELEKAAIERELQMARQVQEGLLPPQMPRLPGWQFGRRWRPAHGVSGDFYDLIQEARQTLGVVMADITDKGMAASLFMVFVRSALRASITRRGTPAQAVINANRVICLDSVEGLFATLVYARLHTDSGEMEYVNAGHPPPLLYHRAQGALQQLQRTGMALGVDADVTYTFRSVRLDPGDFMVFYTDGIIEATDLAGQEYGLERLQAEVLRLCNASTEDLLDGLERSLAHYTAARPAADDITLMVVRRGC